MFSYVGTFCEPEPRLNQAVKRSSGLLESSQAPKRYRLTYLARFSPHLHSCLPEQVAAAVMTVIALGHKAIDAGLGGGSAAAGGSSPSTRRQPRRRLVIQSPTYEKCVPK